MEKKTWLIGIAAVAALGGGLWLGSFLSDRAVPQTPDVGPAAFIYPEARPLPAFSLQSQDRRSFGKAQLEEKWSFLFFGYTFCPDVCPMTLSLFQQVHQALSETPGGVGNAQFVFVSVDPARDTVERLAEYMAYFNPEFIGVTGEPPRIEALTQAIGIVYMRADGGSEEDYLIDHSSAVLLADPKGRLYALFAAPHDAAAITESFRKIRQLGG